MLTRVYLHDGEPEEAVRLVRRSWEGSGRAPSRLTVAAGVAETYPEEAIQFYFGAATDRIEQRGRGNYASATRLLAEARAICLAQHHDAA